MSHDIWCLNICLFFTTKRKLTNISYITMQRDPCNLQFCLWNMIQKAHLRLTVLSKLFAFIVCCISFGSRVSELLLFWHIHHIHFRTRNNLVFLFLYNQQESCSLVNHSITECGETLQEIPAKIPLIRNSDSILSENMYIFL